MAAPPAERADLRELRERRERTSDKGRPVAVTTRHEAGRLTVREQLSTLFGGEPYHEIGSLAVSVQRDRWSQEELMDRTPADGVYTARTCDA